MKTYRFIQLDVFTHEPFAGNSLAVFPEAEGLTDDQMMKIAREMNLSETVFVLKPASSNQQSVISNQNSVTGGQPSADSPGTGSDESDPTKPPLKKEANEKLASEAPTSEKKVLRRLRIFTPAREIPFAGHPVVGTWNALAREGVVPLPDGGNGLVTILHELGVGVLPVDIEFKDGLPEQVVMTQGKFEILAEVDDWNEQAEIARALGLSREDLDETLPIQIISTGLSFLAVPVRAIADLRRCKVNAALLAEVYQRAGSTGCLVFSRETIEIGEARAHARMFAPADNIPEDPATGSACGALGGYLVHHGASGVEANEGKFRFVIEQGDFIKRASRLRLEVTGEAGAVEQVRVGGPSVIVAKGEVFVE